MKNILQKLLLILSVFLAVDLTAGPIEDLVKKIKESKELGVFCSKDGPIRKWNGRFCDASPQVAAYILTVCRKQNGFKDVYDPTTAKTNKQMIEETSSHCKTNAFTTIEKIDGATKNNPGKRRSVVLEQIQKIFTDLYVKYPIPKNSAQPTEKETNDVKTRQEKMKTLCLLIKSASATDDVGQFCK